MKREQIFVEERKRGVLEFVTQRKRATVTELCAHFDVSPATMRSDLRDLEQEGLLVRTHGGATVNEKARFASASANVAASSARIRWSTARTIPVMTSSRP